MFNPRRPLWSPTEIEDLILFRSLGLELWAIMRLMPTRSKYAIKNQIKRRAIPRKRPEPPEFPPLRDEVRAAQDEAPALLQAKTFYRPAAEERTLVIETWKEET